MRLFAGMISLMLTGGVFPVALAEDATVNTVHQFCRMTVGSDNVLLRDCVSRQIAGMLEVTERLGQAAETTAEKGERLRLAYSECRDAWAPDFDLIATCLTKRIDAR